MQQWRLPQNKPHSHSETFQPSFWNKDGKTSPPDTEEKDPNIKDGDQNKQKKKYACSQHNAERRKKFKRTMINISEKKENISHPLKKKNRTLYKRRVRIGENSHKLKSTEKINLGVINPESGTKMCSFLHALPCRAHLLAKSQWWVTPACDLEGWGDAWYYSGQQVLGFGRLGFHSGL